MNCVICGIRKPRRRCPGVHGDICTVCCGTEREQSIDCPISCDYLREAHKHEKPAPLDPAALPNQEVRVPESFVQQYEWLLILLGSAAVDGALIAGGTTDFDIREALQALIELYRTAQSGLIVETKPVNPYAANIYESVGERVAEIRRRIAAAGTQASPDPLTDSTVMGMLVFLQRLEYAHNNGRKRSRAYLDFLLQFHVPALPQEEGAAQTEREPAEPLVIL